MRKPPGCEQYQEQFRQPPQALRRQPSGTTSITSYSKLFGEEIASTNERRFDGDKGGETWRTDIMNYLVGRAPDMESLL